MKVEFNNNGEELLPQEYRFVLKGEIVKDGDLFLFDEWIPSNDIGRKVLTDHEYIRKVI